MGNKKKVVRLANAYLERQNVDWMDLPYFKLTFNDDTDDVSTNYRVIPAGKFNWKVFESLQKMYMEAGDSKVNASIKANKVVVDFYSAAAKCTKDGVSPFKVYITKKFLNK